MKSSILDTIYSRFSDWAGCEGFFCRPGCSSCCTRNVTVTALEAKRILTFIVESGNAAAVADKLRYLDYTSSSPQTTNEYVLTFMEDETAGRSNTLIAEQCPFLEDDLCTIYSVRPFSCRCFTSTVCCTPEQAAVVEDHYLFGSLIVMQILEHLSQSQHWGVLTDMLTGLCHSPGFSGIFQQHIDNSTVTEAQKNLRKAIPLPNYFIPDQHSKQIKPLLQSILALSIGAKTIEQIVNGRRRYPFSAAT